MKGGATVGRKLNFANIKVGEVPNKANDDKLAKAVAVNFTGDGSRWTWLAEWGPVLDLFYKAYEAEKYNEGDSINSFLETAMLVVFSEIYRLLEPPSQALSLLDQLKEEIAKGQNREQWRLSISLVFDKERLREFLQNA